MLIRVLTLALILFKPSLALQGSNIAEPRKRKAAPPFPDGLNSGKIEVLPSSLTFSIDTKLSGNTLLLPPRDIEVWLPPTYDGKQRHSVLYVHDGQNTMEDSKCWTGRSWRLAGALTRLYEYKEIDQMPICVLLPCNEDDLVPGVRRRHLEYGDHTNPFARAHIDFVGNTVVPIIHSTFATYTSPKDNFAMGSSMGGQASLNLLLSHSDKFGGAACMSPFFSQSTIQRASQSADLLKSKRLYFDNGGDTEEARVPLFDIFDHITSEQWYNPGYFWLDTQLQDGIDEMLRNLDQNKIGYSYTKFDGARHNERAWSLRIHKPLLHLFGSSEV